MPRDEASLIERVARAFHGLVADGALGFVDDAALLEAPPDGHRRVITTDMVVEGVDFELGLGPTESVGWRAVAQNLSDVAAMGAAPVGMVWSIALPERWLDDDAALFDAFLAGAAELSREASLCLYGGDLSSTSGPFVASLTVFGDTGGEPLLRSGARPGDLVYVSAPLGASQRGLELLLEGRRKEPDSFAPGAPREVRARFDAWRSRLSPVEQEAVDRHLWPRPEVALGPALVGRATSCMDLSDGLALDLSRLCTASGVGAELDALDAARHPAAGEGDEGRERALGSGEEYALLFTLPPGASVDGLAGERGPPIALGAVRGEAGLVEATPGGPRPLSPRGWQHFG